MQKIDSKHPLKEKEEEKIEKVPAKIKEDDSVLLGSATSDKNNEINKAALNSSLNVEIDKINESLLKIGLMLNSKQNRDIPLESDVADNLSKSVSLWSSMMIGLN